MDVGAHVALVATGVGYGGSGDGEATNAETVTRAELRAALGVDDG
ncbi:hypothetical protein [Halobaculum gomorrense]|nr:hypothetical protein [Halobaculum gomorrense]